MLVVPSKRAAGSGMCLGAAGGHLLGGTGLAPGVGTSSVAQGWFLVVAPPRWWHRAGSWCHLLGGTGLAPGVIRAQGCWWWHTALWGAPGHGARCLASGLAPVEMEKHRWGLHHQLTWIVFCFNGVALIPRCGHKCLQTRPWDGMASSAPGASWSARGIAFCHHAGIKGKKQPPGAALGSHPSYLVLGGNTGCQPVPYMVRAGAGW